MTTTTASSSRKADTSWRLYKPGQGYWTRMLSAVGGGLLVVAGAAWLWQKLDAFQQDWIIFVQAGLAVVIIGVFGALLYRYIGSKPRTCDFLIATEGEMKKVNWPPQKQVIGSTWIVICCVFLLAALLFLADLLFSWIFREFGILNI